METSIHSITSVHPGILSETRTKVNVKGAPGDTGQNDPSRNTFSQDLVDISPEAREASQKDKAPEETKSSPPSTDKEFGLNQEQQQQLMELKSRDLEVRTHEQAHLSAAGQYAAGSASFTYQQGPDGSRYAIGGEVPIDISKESTPEATILKMETVRNAALAPAEPSAADRQIAAKAAMTASQARQELVMKQQEDTAAPESAKNEQNGETETSTESKSTDSSQDYPSSATLSAMINAYTSMQTLG